MTQWTTFGRILEAIWNDESLSNALWAHLLPSPSQNTSVRGQDIGNIHPGTQQTNPELVTQMYQSGSKPVLAAYTLQSSNTNSQQCTGVDDNPLVSHISQLGNRDPVLQEPMAMIPPELVSSSLMQTIQGNNWKQVIMLMCTKLLHHLILLVLKWLMLRATIHLPLRE